MRRLCVCCDTITSPNDGSCTNGCCRDCHRLNCSPGGGDKPGHTLNPDLRKRAPRYQVFEKVPGRETARIHNVRTRREADELVKRLDSAGTLDGFWDTIDNSLSGLLRF